MGLQAGFRLRRWVIYSTTPLVAACSSGSLKMLISQRGLSVRLSANTVATGISRVKLTSCVRHVISPPSLVLLTHLFDSSNIFRAQLNLLEILPDPGRRHALGDDGVAANLAPSQNDLCRGSADLIGNRLDLGAGDEQRDIEEVVAKGRVGGNMDILLLCKSDELLGAENRVTLDLVDGGDDAGLLDEGLEVLDGEVGDADGADLGLGQLSDGLPGLNVGYGGVDVDFVCGGEWEEVRVGVLAGAKRDWPVDKVEVEVVELELGEGVVESGFDVFGVVLRIPQLGGDEDILTLEARNLGERLLDALGNFLLVLVAVVGGKLSAVNFSDGNRAMEPQARNPSTCGRPSPPRGRSSTSFAETLVAYAIRNTYILAKSWSQRPVSHRPRRVFAHQHTKCLYPAFRAS